MIYKRIANHSLIWLIFLYLCRVVILGSFQSCASMQCNGPFNTQRSSPPSHAHMHTCTYILYAWLYAQPVTPSSYLNKGTNERIQEVEYKTMGMGWGTVVH